jgi:hypothetical protein
MPSAIGRKQPAKKPAAIDLEAELARIAAMNIGELRSLWRERLYAPPSAGRLALGRAPAGSAARWSSASFRVLWAPGLLLSTAQNFVFAWRERWPVA